MNNHHRCLTQCGVLFLAQLTTDDEFLMADGLSVSSLLRQGFVELGELGWAITESGREALKRAPTDDRRARRMARRSTSPTAHEPTYPPGMTFWVSAQEGLRGRAAADLQMESGQSS